MGKTRKIFVSFTVIVVCLFFNSAFASAESKESLQISQKGRWAAG